MSLADIYKDGVLAATFEAAGADTVFRYVPSYDAVAIAHTLPLGVEVVRPGRSTPPFFANLLPEGRRLSALQRAAKTSGDDELTLLLTVGSSPIGDVQITPAGQGPGNPEPVISGEQPDFAALMAEHGVDPVAIPGVQDKLSAGMITLPGHTSAGAEAIVKLTPSDYPFAVENEAFFLNAAKGLRLPVVTASVVRDVHGTPGLVVQRFDRDEGRRAVEDACQLLGRYPSDKYLVTAEEVAVAVAEACAARPVALRNVYLQFVFAWLIGNGDLHAKNISILQQPDGEWRVAPIYDVLSTLFYRDHTMALTMGGRDTGFLRRHLVAFGTDIGLPAVAAERSLDLALRAAHAAVEALGRLPYNANLTQDVRRQLLRRHRDAAA